MNALNGVLTMDSEGAEEFSKEIWETLSVIDVNEYTEKKKGGTFNPTYLSWTWAWKTMMEHYPQFQYEFAEDTKYGDGTMTVTCVATIGPVSRVMWLPVMDHKYNAKPNPSARDISDARMRCLTKVMALFGLGHYIYAGEDIPQTPAGLKESPPTNGLTDSQKEKYSTTAMAMIAFIEEETDVEALRKFWKDNKTVLSELSDSDSDTFETILSSFRAKAESLQG